LTGIFITLGQETIIENHSKGTATYRAVFPGGFVSFDVIPGGRFKLCITDPAAEIHIEDFAPGGVHPLGG